MKKITPWFGQNGISLVESLLVIVLLGLLVLLMANLPNAMTLITKSQHLSLAREIASKQLEDKRATSYANLVNDNISLVDSRLSLLPEGQGNILVEDCPANTCTNAENVKHIVVTVTWQDNAKTQTVKLETFVGEGGLGQ